MSWKKFLLRKLDIREGEFLRVSLMQANVFLLIQSLWIIKPVVNAQFLSSVGIEKLPSAFLLVALTALAFSIGYSRLLTRLPLGKIISRTYYISIISLLAVAMLMSINIFQGWMSYVIYIAVALFGLITTSQFWLLGNLIFTSMQAKRLFGLIGAGAIAGGISGGYITSTLAPMIDSPWLLVVAAGWLIISMLVSQKIWNTFVPVPNQVAQSHPTPHFKDYPFHLIYNSKHLTFLATIMGISVVVDKLVEFQFSSIASSRISNPEELTAFFGFWFSTANVVSLIFQLFITQKLVALLGVGRSLFIFPGALFAGASIVLHTPVLWAGTTLKVIDISLKQSINKAASELLILPIPLNVKSQAKSFIDVFIDTTATGIGGLLLIFIVNGLDLSVRTVCMMILLLTCIWVYFTIRLRKEYIKTFQEKLGLHDKTHKKSIDQLWDKDVLNGISRTLHSGTTRQILFLLSMIEETRNTALMNDIIPLLVHHSAAVRQAALRCLYFHKDHAVTSHILPLLHDDNEEVRYRAFSCLLAHTDSNRFHMIDEYLNHEDPAIRGAALVGLATEARDNPQKDKIIDLEKRIQIKINETGLLQDSEAIKANKIVIMRAIGYGKLKYHYPELSSYMRDNDPEIVKKAMLAAGSSQDPFLAKELISFLLQKTTRSAARKALAKLESASLFSILVDMEKDEKTNIDVLLQLPALAGVMDVHHASKFLFYLSEHHEPEVRKKALQMLNYLKAKFPKLPVPRRRIQHSLTKETNQYKENLVVLFTAQQSLTILNKQTLSIAGQERLHGLDKKKQTLLKNIFLTLALTYPPELILPLLKDLRNKDQNVRINALELLDNILTPLHKHTVIPIMETALIDTPSADDLQRIGLEPITNQL